MSLTSADRIKITSDVIFAVSPVDDDVLGLGTQTAVVDGANYSVTASADWVRGIYAGQRYQFTGASTLLLFASSQIDLGLLKMLSLGCALEAQPTSMI